MGGKAHPLGYVVICVQVEGVPEYNEDQVAFVVDDNTTFSWRVPVVLGTPTINRIVMKESNLNNAPMEWQASKTSYELANGFLMRRLHLEPEGGFPTNTGENPVDLDETVSLTSKCRTALRVGHCAWPYPANYDDGSPIERHDPGPISRRYGGSTKWNLYYMCIH